MEMQSSSSHHEAPDTSSVPPPPPPPPPSDGAPLQDHALLPQSIEHSVAVQEAEMSEEEVKGSLEAVASTGKFWQDWEKLKGMLSWWLKKVLSEYPEAKMTDEQQKEALGETYSQLVNRLDEALLNFDEGPPFTLQRLCEILLAARSIYPKLSKLALALEKNLLVTSMLSISTDPQLETTENTNAATEDTGTAAANWAQNGIEAVGGDKDEIMTEVEEADVDDAMTIDMETIDEPSETTTTTASESEKPSETNAAEPSSDSMAAEEGDSRLP
ncbi:hypothetical protein BRARA_B00691 [Brassica rapa]|uniref:Serine/threonine-protein phosphatase 4 regulatory subunit 2 n=2 Tax=Brassica campestris TaxID=3711 RepID=A0A398A6W1_BRACM|nr:hypothetical protein IGI04_004914 [Brassica rapa subsp. trilocularis]RID73541.1 hypothetical protein BRARA_B00691 [Brassica rapa]